MSSDDGHTLLVIGAPQHDAAAYYLSGFLAPDAVWKRLREAAPTLLQ